MSDQNQTADDVGEPGDAADEGNEYEVERLVTRAEGAVALRRLADGVANGSVELGDEQVVVAVPDQFELEIEYEQEHEEAELEVELEWPVVDGEAVAAERERESDESGDTGETETGADDSVTGGAGEDGEPAEDGEPVAQADAEKPIDEVVGTGSTASSARFELYRDRANEWRWRLVHDNGNIIADSGEGYDRKATARNGLESVMRNASGAAIDVLDD